MNEMKRFVVMIGFETNLERTAEIAPAIIKILKEISDGNMQPAWATHGGMAFFIKTNLNADRICEGIMQPAGNLGRILRGSDRVMVFEIPKGTDMSTTKNANGIKAWLDHH